MLTVIILQRVAYLTIKIAQKVAQRLLNRLIPVTHFLKNNRSSLFSQSWSHIAYTYLAIVLILY